MERIRFVGHQGAMGGIVDNVPCFPGESFSLGIPEAIGDSARALWFGSVRVEWRELGDGVWQSIGHADNELDYAVTVTPRTDTLDVSISLTNRSEREWSQGMAFNCFNCGSAASVRDYECVRHYAGIGGRAARLIQIPRKFGPRPTIQLYNVDGAPNGHEIPFVSGFRATPEPVLEGWLAIQARDRKRLAAVVSRPALFLFQNMEYSCIHSAPGFGPMKPGDTRNALTRVYFVEAAPEELRSRMRDEMGANAVSGL